MRIFAILMVLVFIGFAIVQYNDPDPQIWIPIYLIPAVLSVQFIRGSLNKYVYLVTALLFLFGSIYMWPEQWEGVALKNGMKTRFIEEGRESLGLAICFAALVVYWLIETIRSKAKVQ